jgi:mono/diheme cytochrome c family protein
MPCTSVELHVVRKVKCRFTLCVAASSHLSCVAPVTPRSSTDGHNTFHKCSIGVGLKDWSSRDCRDFGGDTTEATAAVQGRVSPRRASQSFSKWLLAPFALALALSTGSPAAAQANPARGLQVISDHGCAACHSIPGVRWPVGRVGPPLAGFGRHVYIAGVLTNSPEALSRWLRDPQAVKPRTAMPNVGLSEAQASDAAAYLSSLK